MLYRKLGNTGRDVSVLGFGCMRLPLKQGLEKASDVFDGTKPIDEDQATAMIHHAIERGVNYFDTAYPYHGGQSEAFLGKALSGYRDRVMVATKSPIWLVQTTADFDRFLDEQLGKLNTHYVDFYLLHSLGRQSWQRMKDLGALPFLERILKDGRARFAGFSFHDEVKIFKEIVDGYDWAMCQIQYNYFDEHYQAGKEGLRYAAAKGLGVVVMEPLRGGKLTGAIPPEVQAIWDSAAEKRTPAEWALRWVWNHPEVSTALSGVSAREQIDENIRIAAKGEPNSLTPAELELIDRVTRTYREMVKVNCTGCAYCVPCPNGVDIPLNFSLYNDTFMFKDSDIAYMIYTHFTAPEQRASNCAECGECEEHCPQHLEIREELKKVHARLSQG